jgi:tripeptide aminopeptidase
MKTNSKTRSKAARPRRGISGNQPESETVQLLLELMAIPGASGDERAMADRVRQELISAGAKPDSIVTDQAHRRTPVAGNTGNLIFKLPGKSGLPRRLLMAHLDTVPVCVGTQPVLRGRQIVSANPRTGVGADNRAGVAVVLSAALRMLRQPPAQHAPVTFLWTVQEEIGLFGARFIRPSLLGNPKLAFNWDGGLPVNVTIGATGGYRMELVVHGRASHAGNAPEQGVSAIAIASLAIARLHQEGWHGLIEKQGRLGTSNVGIIRGGDATNVVTDRVELRAEARSHDPKFRQQIVKRIEQAFRAALAEVKGSGGHKGSVEFSGHLDYESFRLRQDEACVQVAQQAIIASGGVPEFRVANGGLDANWMTANGIPTVTMGCGQRNVHTVSEALEVDEFLQACRIGWILASGAEQVSDAAGR